MDKKYKDIHILLNHRELYCYRQIEGAITIFKDRIEVYTENIEHKSVKIVILLPYFNGYFTGLSVVVD